MSEISITTMQENDQIMTWITLPAWLQRDRPSHRRFVLCGQCGNIRPFVGECRQSGDLVF